MEDPNEYPFAFAFLDVLGWKNLTAGEDKAVVDELRGIVAQSAGGVIYPGSVPSARSGNALTKNLYTDAIVIERSLTGMSGIGGEMFWHCIDFTCHTLLSHGWLVRGAVIVDWRSQYERATIRAVALEKSANYPMIVVDSQGGGPNPLLTTGWHGSEGGCPYRGLLRQLENQNWVFDFWRYVSPMLTEVERKSQVRAKLETFRPIIVMNLEKHAPSKGTDERVTDKHRWFASYFNEVAEEVGAAKIDMTSTTFQ